MSCGTGKISYPSRRDARASGAPGAAYRCGYCGQWHMTTKGRNFKPRTVLKASGQDARVQRVFEL